MTRAEKIKILKGYVSADIKLKGITVRMEAAKARTEEQIAMLRNLLILPSSSGDGTGIRGGGGTDKFATVYAAIDDAERRYAALAADAAETVTELSAQKRAVEEAVDAVDDAQQAKLLTLRYILDMRWYDIAEMMSVSESYVRGTLHTAAIDAVKF